MLRSRVFAVILILLGGVAVAAAKDFALISNKSNHVEAVTLAELVKICKGQMEHWPDGKAVSLVTRDPASPEMRIVLEKIYGIPKEEVLGLISSANHARVSHPAIVVVDSDDAVVKKVESNPGAVGLVDVYAITGGVDVIRVGGKLPLQPGYALHGN
ncbi:MAG: substrate-binding domain-containing protein [Terriglobales bacterium]